MVQTSGLLATPEGVGYAIGRVIGAMFFPGLGVVLLTLGVLKRNSGGGTGATVMIVVGALLLLLGCLGLVGSVVVQQD